MKGTVTVFSHYANLWEINSPSLKAAWCSVGVHKQPPLCRQLLPSSPSEATEAAAARSPLSAPQPHPPANKYGRPPVRSRARAQEEAQGSYSVNHSAERGFSRQRQQHRTTCHSHKTDYCFSGESPHTQLSSPAHFGHPGNCTRLAVVYLMLPTVNVIFFRKVRCNKTFPQGLLQALLRTGWQTIRLHR